MKLRLQTTAFVAAMSLLTVATTAAPPRAEWFPQAPPLPNPSGNVLRVSTVDELFTASKDIKPGGTILVADGHYRMPRYFELTTDNVTLRSASANRENVILDGATSRHGELIGITDCEGVTIADLTIQNVKFNGIKINSDRGAQRVTIHNCVIHNVWQRGVKAPGIRDDDPRLRPRDCRVQYCLFYNDRPKQFADDETDTPQTFNGNYIGGIDAKNTSDWRIADNVFLGIQGRTREGRGCVYLSECGRGCVIERNFFLNCDIAVALGNPSLEYSKHHAVMCTARNNFITRCPETGILACYTKDCEITNNTIHDPNSRRRRLIWVQNRNDGLRLRNNLLVGPPIQISRDSEIDQHDNAVFATLAHALSAKRDDAGQTVFAREQIISAIQLPEQLKVVKAEQQASLVKPGLQPEKVIAAMRKIHGGFEGQKGYVAQFGDSITYSMAFWSAIGWDNPERFLTHDDGLPKTPTGARWRDYVKGTREKGPPHANYSGWTVGQLNKAVDQVLRRNKPEVAIIMIGTNDISSGSVPKTYRGGLEQIVQKCLDVHCVPILNTIPPRRSRDEAVRIANEIIRDVASKMRVPLADFHAECLRLRPDNSWDGTIIAGDGVHPSGGKANVYTEENMKSCGYALRNWVNFLVLRQIYFRVLEPTDE